MTKGECPVGHANTSHEPFELCLIALRENESCSVCEENGVEATYCENDWSVCVTCYKKYCPLVGGNLNRTSIDLDDLFISPEMEALLKDTVIEKPDTQTEEIDEEEIYIPFDHFQCPHCGKKEGYVEIGYCSYSTWYDTHGDQQDTDYDNREQEEFICQECDTRVCVMFTYSKGDLATFDKEMEELSKTKAWSKQ